MNWQVVLAYFFGLGLIYLFMWVLYYPLKITTKILLNAIFGMILLLIVNVVGQIFAITLPINPVTALVAGFLGIPGIVLLLVLRFFIL